VTWERGLTSFTGKTATLDKSKGDDNGDW
jgi:hypothetical protein